jgi:hypothetical protein
MVTVIRRLPKFYQLKQELRFKHNFENSLLRSRKPLALIIASLPFLLVEIFPLIAIT